MTGDKKSFSFLPGEGEYEHARLREAAFAILE